MSRQTELRVMSYEWLVLVVNDGFEISNE